MFRRALTIVALCLVLLGFSTPTQDEQRVGPFMVYGDASLVEEFLSHLEVDPSIFSGVRIIFEPERPGDGFYTADNRTVHVTTDNPDPYRTYVILAHELGHDFDAHHLGTYDRSWVFYNQTGTLPTRFDSSGHPMNASYRWLAHQDLWSSRVGEMFAEGFALATTDLRINRHLTAFTQTPRRVSFIRSLVEEL